MSTLVLDRPWALTYEALFAPAPDQAVCPPAEGGFPALELARIVAGCKAGNPESFSALLDIYAGRCFGYFYRLTGDGDLSEELLSRLFLRIVRKIDSYNGGVFDGWLFRIASNIFHDHLRKKKRQKRLMEVRRSILESAVVEPKTSDQDSIDKLQTQLRKLDTDTKEIIILRFYSDLTIKEIAALRKEPPGTISSRLHRGINRLKELMA